MSNILSLTKELISIPSYVSGTINESKIGEYIYVLLQKNKNLVVEKQHVEGNRYNIFAYTKNSLDKQTINLDTLYINHIDTVPPQNGWKTDQYTSVIKEDKLYGLGSFDTKGNVAVLLSIALKTTTQQCGFLFYIDEEYAFKGIYSFIKNNMIRMICRRIISADGEQLQIRKATRGLVELDITIEGKSGHAGNPKNGNNAITILFNSYTDLQTKCALLKDKELGLPTTNISYILGGTGVDNGIKINVQNYGNIIPNYATATIEIRTTTALTAQIISQHLTNAVRYYKGKVKSIIVRHDLPASSSTMTSFKDLKQAFTKYEIQLQIRDPQNAGYVDIAILANELTVPWCCVGTCGANAHAPNEYVLISSLQKLRNILMETL